MKCFASFLVLLAISFAPASLAAQTGEHPALNTIFVRHFTNANGMGQSQDFIKSFSDYICIALEKDKLATNVVDQDTPAPDAVPDRSVVIEGKFLSHVNAGLVKPGKLLVEISIYRLSDHALVRTLTPETKFPPRGDEKDRVYAYYTGTGAGEAIWDSLRGIDLSNITPASSGSSSAATAPAESSPAPMPSTAAATPPSPVPAPVSSAAPAAPSGPAPMPASTAAQAGTDEAASVQLSSNPDGADITIDGSYVGNTPSLIKLKPGTHSITMTLPGYAPWTRSIETAAGESRNFSATLQKSSQ